MLALLIEFYSLVVFARVLVSWFSLGNDHPVVHFLHQATEPVLGPLRRVLPPMGGIDLSPIVLLLLLQLVGRALLRL